MEGVSPEKAGVGGSTPSLATIIPRTWGFCRFDSAQDLAEERH